MRAERDPQKQGPYGALFLLVLWEAISALQRKPPASGKSKRGSNLTTTGYWFMDVVPSNCKFSKLHFSANDTGTD